MISLHLLDSGLILWEVNQRFIQSKKLLFVFYMSYSAAPFPILQHQSFFQKLYFMNVKCVQCQTSLLWLC